jgi:hypothetical protein
VAAQVNRKGIILKATSKTEFPRLETELIII